MRLETQMRLALVVSVLCFAVIVVCLARLLGQGGVVGAIAPTAMDADRDPLLPKIEMLRNEMRTLRAEHEAGEADRKRLSDDVTQKDRIIATQREELQALAEQLRRRPANP